MRTSGRIRYVQYPAMADVRILVPIRLPFLIRWPSPEAVEDKEPLPSLLHAALIEDVEGRPRPALELAKKAQVDHLSTCVARGSDR